jgi:type III pantothenate kinase|tara:strand:+ start:60 stop:710 length:651 start_codon:yes stop_codon:yes gene_type:complete
LGKKVPVYFLEHNLTPDTIQQIGMSSVVPEINQILIDFCKNYFGLEPYLISPNSYSKLPIKTKRPQEMGTDLMCNGLAAWYKFKNACIVVDFGTALTFTILDDSGEIMGVNIVPGLRTAIKALFMNTSKLPDVDLKLPESAIGKNTVHAIQAGILYGYTGLVKGMLETIRKEAQLDFKVVATGGLSEILTSLEQEFDTIDKNLTLEGLRLMTLSNL